MTLSGPTNATLKSDAKTATGTINDDDALPVLSIADATAVAEGEAAQFVVTLAPASSKQVTVSYSTADGTAKASEDYTAASSATQRTVSVATTEDTRNEATEAFTDPDGEGVGGLHGGLELTRRWTTTKTTKTVSVATTEDTRNEDPRKRSR